MNRLREHLRAFFVHHWFVLVFGVVLTLLIEAPVIAFPFVAGKAYAGINIPHFGSDAHLYLTRGKEALEGNRLGNPALREGKDGIDYYFTVMEYALTLPPRLLGLAEHTDIVTLYNVYNAVGIFALIMLIYGVALRLMPNRLFAAAAALFVVGGYSIVYHHGTLFYDDFNIYERPTVPYIPALFFWAYLLALLHALASSTRRNRLLAGALFGFLFFLYFFAWTFALACTIALLAFFAARAEWASLKSVSFILGVGLLLGLSTVVRIILFMHSPAGKQFSYFSWSQYSHAPVLSGLLFSMLFFLFLFAWKCRNDANLPFLFSLIVAGWLSLNQQVVTGRMVQHNHYYWFFFVPVAIICGLYMLWRLLPSAHARGALFGTFIALVFLNTAVGQYRSFWTTFEYKLYEQTYRPLIDALSAEPRGVIFAANDTFAELFTIYTRNDLFWHDMAQFNDNPLERFQDALFAYLYAARESRTNPEEALRLVDEVPNSAAPVEEGYRSVYQSIEGYRSGFDFYEYQRRGAAGDAELRAKEREIRVELSAQFRKTMQDPDDLLRLLERYGVAYVVWDANRHPEWDLSVMPNLREVAENQGVYLYRI